MTDEIELQKLWLSLQHKKWRVLAVISACPKSGSLAIAKALADVASQLRSEKTVVLDLHEVRLRLIEQEKKRIAEYRERGENVVLALPSPDQNPAGMEVAGVADLAIVVVRIGETSLDAVTRAADQIGREKVAGVVIARPKATPEPSPAPIPRPAAIPKPIRPAAATQPMRPAAAANATVKMAAPQGAKN